MLARTSSNNLRLKFIAIRKGRAVVTASTMLRTWEQLTVNRTTSPADQVSAGARPY
jgi:hypothetical protein